MIIKWLPLRHCPDCGIEIDSPTAKFCEACGQYLFPPHIAVDYEGLEEDVKLPERKPFPKKWIVSYSYCFNQNGDDEEDSGEDDYPTECDRLEAILRSTVVATLSNATQTESQRDGECLGVRFMFYVRSPASFPRIPQVPPFKIMEVLPAVEVYDDIDEEEDDEE